MTQLYYLKNGGVGNFSDVYKESCVEELGKIPRRRLAGYVEQLIKAPSCFANDAERLKDPLKALTSSDTSIAALHKSLEVIADIEYSRVFSSDSEISGAAEHAIRSLGRKKY